MDHIPERHRALAAKHKDEGALIQVQHQCGSNVWLAVYDPKWAPDRNYRLAQDLTDAELQYLQGMHAKAPDAEARLREKVADEMARKDRERLAAIQLAEELKQKVATQVSAQPGQIIAFSCGEYSDYQVKCHMRVLVAFATVDEMLKYTAERGKVGRYASRDDPDKFIAWLQAKGFIEPLEPDELMEWWLSDGYAIEP